MRKKFVNPHANDKKRTLLHFFLWQAGYYKDSTDLPPVPHDFVYPNPKETKVIDSEPIVTWVNHSTFWIRAFGTSILVDPIWNRWCSPLPFLGPKREMNPQPGIDKINKVDYVIISHNHYDHLDKKTLTNLHHQFPMIHWIVPKGVRTWLRRVLKVDNPNITELNWWENIQLNGILFTAVPAQHFSGRGFFDRNKSLWMGCVVEFLQHNKRFYFAGDTGYNDYDFKEIGNKFGGMDLSLLPIGSYAPRAFMRPMHINPDESVKIHSQVGSKLSVGGHWGTFRLSSEERTRPPYDLFNALKNAHISTREFRVLQPGQSINW